MKKPSSRRQFIKKSIAVAGLGAIGYPPMVNAINFRKTGYKLKLSLNVYSFNSLLRNGEIDLWDVVDFCAANKFDAIDPTGYYFPGYPEVPSETYINDFKKKTFLLGLDISGTGVRNDFANPDKVSRKEDIELIHAWTEAAARLGAPALRIFPGHHDHEGFSREQVFEWMADDIRTCCRHAEKYGVMIAIQNHNGFLKTAEDVNRLFTLVNSNWLGLNLDIGSYRQYPPYAEIQKNVDKAITWQIKENVWINGQETPTDFDRLLPIIKQSGYRGYLPLETLGGGDPFEKVPVLLAKVKEAINKS